MRIGEKEWGGGGGGEGSERGGPLYAIPGGHYLYLFGCNRWIFFGHDG
jgi:hypothetical protein